jgi:preprotein translocase subunit SecG
MTFILVLSIIVCILLILIVVIQNPKGGGIASNFSAGNQIMGVRRTNDFVEKATWTLAGALLVLALASNIFTGGTATVEERKSSLDEALNSGQFDDYSTPENIGTQPAPSAEEDAE